MSNKDKKQEMLDKLLEAINLTGRNEGKNPIIALKLIDKPTGRYVRPVFKDNPNRNDGYYDINVTATSAMYIAKSVMEWVAKKL